MPAGAARYRLTGVGTFEALFRRGKRREGRYLQLVYAPTLADVGRVGYVIGRKTLSRAVDRNRVKRMLRHVVQAARPRIEVYDLIVRLKKTCPRSEFRRVADEAGLLLASLPVLDPTA